MKLFVLTILAAALSPTLFSSHAFAEPAEFLIPVTGSEEAIARAKNDYFLQKNTYFAKRHRIVTVNVQLLVSAEQLKIGLFEDASVTVEVTDLKIRNDGLSIGWTGRFVEPSTTIDDLIDDGFSREEAKILQPDMETIRIFAAEISYDETTGTKYQYSFPDFEFHRTSAAERSADENSRVNDSSALYDVVTTIQSMHIPHLYQLRPLESDPRYHLLIEIDPEKTFSKGPMEDPENPEQATKRREYRDFKRNLGPDPRPTDLHKKSSP